MRAECEHEVTNTFLPPFGSQILLQFLRAADGLLGAGIRTLGEEKPDVLLDVAAFAVASAQPAAAAEAFVAPALAASVAGYHQPAALTAEQARWAALTTPVRVAPLGSGDVPGPFVGPQPIAGGVPDSLLAKLAGITLLDELGLDTPAQIQAFMQQNPQAIAEFVAHPPAPADVAQFWDRATPSQKVRLEAAAPSVIGNLEGVPYAERNAANRVSLQGAIDSLAAQLDAGVGRAAHDSLQDQLHMLQQVQQSLQTGPSGLPRTLVSLDATGSGRAAIAIGDLSTADYVTYLVPGMFYGVDQQFGAWTTMADQFAEQQNLWLQALTPGTAKTAATISWIGYQTPTLINVASTDLAAQGKDALAASLGGLDAARAGGRPYVTVIGHSYGSTTAMLALQNDGVTVDALAVVGSPGSPAQTASELDVRGDNVWVGAAPLDYINQSGVFGSQPLSPSFGAHHFGVDGATDPVTGEQLSAALTHNDYFTVGGESFRNLTLIAIGRGDLVLQ